MARPLTISDDEFLAALRRLSAGETLGEIIASLPIGEASFRWRYKKMFGRPLRLLRKRPPDFRVPRTDTVLAYMAGIIDGEGWITSSKADSWTVAFASTDRSVIDYFGRFGGRTYTRCDKSLRGGTIKSVKRQWTWSLHRAADVAAFLDAIRPYMVIKGARADECLDSTRRRLAGHMKMPDPSR